MKVIVLPLLALAFAVSPALGKSKQARDIVLTPDAINQAQWSAQKPPGRQRSARKASGGISPVVIKAQVLLAKAGFSPGVIDGLGGDNFAKALRVFQERNGLDGTGSLDEATWTRLAAASQDAVVRTYTVAATDVEGPFVTDMPKDFREMSKLEQLAYRSPVELLAEKFRSSEKLLVALNKGQRFDRADAQIVVPNVEELDMSSAPAQRSMRRQTVGSGGSAKGPQAARVEVDKPGQAVRVFDRAGGLMAFYPASIGSKDKPAPSGDFKITSVKRNPIYRYDPKFAFKGQKAKQPVEVPPGPNNPVGLAWIGLSAPTYGFHGAAEPDRVGKSASHGCVRLTNWDALALAKLVRKGTPVAFKD